MSVQIQRIHVSVQSQDTCERPDTEVTCECPALRLDMSALIQRLVLSKLAF